MIIRGKKYFLLSLIFLGVLFSAVGGAIADRVFVLKPVDFFMDRYGLSNTRSSDVQSTQEIVKEESVVINVVKQSKPSVVTISIVKQQQKLGNFFLNPFGGFQTPDTVEIETIKRDIGSGFVIDKNGLIVTNKHVVSDRSAQYKVILSDDSEFEVKKIYRDPSNDLAILKIDAEVIPMSLGDSDQLDVGQFVIAIGTALGEFRQTVTTGVVSGLGRGIEAGDQYGGFAEELDDVIQTDTAINPGNSGGPLLNSQGKVIGVNTAVSVQGQNIAFAIPINVVKQSLDIFFKTGEFERPYFGVQYRIIPRETAILNDLPEGAYIVNVISGGSAQQADIRVGDILMRVDNQEISSMGASLAEIISTKKVGETIEVLLWRDEEKITKTVVLQSNQEATQ
ncbi:MAG: Protease Do [Microgenomates group bacterium GW2011_GWF2_45_18]|nr:MAG: Protease Do [Microgenomates group bacterium GW2011_GWF1_44_10]KKU01817.1 MAG: Protease Do [Microgenomates group bacterium GW2011_GWF2_45_18]